MFRTAQPLCQGMCGVILNVEEEYARSLLNEGFNNGLADSARAARDKDDLAFQAAVTSGR